MFLAILMTAGLVSCEGTPISSSTISLPSSERESNSTSPDVSTGKGTSSLPSSSTHGNLTDLKDLVLFEEETIFVTLGLRHKIAFQTDPYWYQDEVVFSSADESVARVDEQGEIFGVKPGKTTITLSVSEGKKTLERHLDVIVMSEAYVLEVELLDDVLTEKDSVDGKEVEKYLLDPNGTYRLNAILPVGNGLAQNEITFSVEKGKEEFLSIDSDGTIRTGSKTCDLIGIDIHVQYADFLDRRVYFAIEETGILIGKELGVMRQGLQRLEDEECSDVVFRYAHYQGESTRPLEDSFSEQYNLYSDSVRKCYYPDSPEEEMEISRLFIEDGKLVEIFYDPEDFDNVTRNERIIGADVSMEEAELLASRAFVQGYHGLTSYLFDFLFGEEEFGSAEDRAHYVRTKGDDYCIRSERSSGDRYFVREFFLKESVGTTIELEYSDSVYDVSSLDGKPIEESVPMEREQYLFRYVYGERREYPYDL